MDYPIGPSPTVTTVPDHVTSHVTAAPHAFGVTGADITTLVIVGVIILVLGSLFVAAVRYLNRRDANA